MVRVKQLFKMLKQTPWGKRADSLAKEQISREYGSDYLLECLDQELDEQHQYDILKALEKVEPEHFGETSLEEAKRTVRKWYLSLALGRYSDRELQRLNHGEPICIGEPSRRQIEQTRLIQEVAHDLLVERGVYRVVGNTTFLVLRVTEEELFGV